MRNKLKTALFFVIGFIIALVCLFLFTLFFPKSEFSVSLKNFAARGFGAFSNPSPEKLIEQTLEKYPFNTQTFIGARPTPNEPENVDIGGVIELVTATEVTLILENDKLTVNLPVGENKIARIGSSVQDTVFILPSDLKPGDILIVTAKPISQREFYVSRAQIPSIIPK